jgi:hypothetical protein
MRASLGATGVADFLANRDCKSRRTGLSPASSGQYNRGKTSALLIAVMGAAIHERCRSREDYIRPIAGAKIADRIATGEWTTAAARGYPGQRLSVHAA